MLTVFHGAAMSSFSGIARVKPPRFIHGFLDAVSADAKHVGAEIKVGAAECVVTPSCSGSATR